MRSVADLFTLRTATSLLAQGITYAQNLGLLPTTWRTGDPTKSVYTYIANALAQSDLVVQAFIQAGFLSSASGDWLKILAVDTFGVTPIAATYSTPTITLHNTGGGVYTFADGDKTFQSSISGKTFHNNGAQASLLPGQTITYNLIADGSGSASSVNANDIDTVISSMLGVVIVSSGAAIALDDEGDAALKIRCAASTGALSPNGPADAYNFVVLNPVLTGSTEITRAKSFGNSGTLAVTVYVFGATGAVSGGALTAALAAIMTWAAPLTVVPTVLNATAVPVAVTCTIHGAAIPGTYAATISAALASLFATLSIADNVGYSLDQYAIAQTIRNALPQITNLTLTLPAGPVALTVGQVPTLGAVSVTLV